VADQGAKQSIWLQLGPTGELPITTVRVAPDWPRNRVVLALRDGRLVRSRDGGTHWELLTTPETFVSLELVPSAGSDPLVLFGTSRSTTPHSVYRSTAAGEDWQPVLVVPDGPDAPDGSPELILSPSFVQDQVAFLAWGRHMYRSIDAGASWTELPRSGGELRLSPTFGQDGFAFIVARGEAVASHDRGLTWTDAGIAPDLWVQDVQFSPAFVSDNTIFATARSDPTADDSATSPGVLVSTDAGATWLTSSDGLAVDGVPYLSVGRLLVSPTYAQDHTLYVVAFGPRTERARGLALWPLALFQSVDGASSWRPVTVVAGYPDRDSRAFFALSPAFAQDNKILWTHIDGLLSSRPSGCTAQLSSDAGATWSAIDPRWPDRYWTCGAPRLLGTNQQLVGAFRDGGEGGVGWNIWVDTDAGPEWFRSPHEVTSPPVGAADGTVFVGASSGGVWARGPSAQPTAGSLACTIQPMLGFGRVYAAQVWARDVLGCALDAERVIGIHQSISRDRPAYLLDDDPTHWYVLQDGGYESMLSMYSPFPASGERTYRGAVQHFEGGLMLYTTQPSGQHLILVLGGRATGYPWRTWPDP
jgi:hypothetical protein